MRMTKKISANSKDHRPADDTRGEDTMNTDSHTTT